MFVPKVNAVKSKIECLSLGKLLVSVYVPFMSFPVIPCQVVTTWRDCAEKTKRARPFS
jgi:hypothetical protein